MVFPCITGDDVTPNLRTLYCLRLCALFWLLAVIEEEPETGGSLTYIRGFLK